MLMRFDPFRDLDKITQQLWQDVAKSGTPMDAYRKGDQFYVHFDLPGVDPSTIDVTVEKNVLTVSARRERSYGEVDEFVVAERPYGEFRRQLFLGDTLDADSIQAGYDSGVLTLVLPVAEKAKPRKVEITTHSQQKQIAGSAS